MNKKVKYLSVGLTIFLLVLSISIDANSLPNDTIEQWESWDKQQTFFPIGDADGREPSSIGDGELAYSNEVLYYKPLSENRVLTYRIGRDFFGTNKIYYESFYVTNVLAKNEDDIVDFCKGTPLTQYPTVSIFQGGSDREDCIKNIGVDFTDLNQPETTKILKNIYGTRHKVILDDLRAANVLKKGQIFYKYNFSSRSRQALKYGPIDVLYLQGNKFQYLITNYGMSITPKNQIDSFKLFLEEWILDSQLRNKMVQQERQMKIDEDRKKPFEL